MNERTCLKNVPANKTVPAQMCLRTRTYPRESVAPTSNMGRGKTMQGKVRARQATQGPNGLEHRARAPPAATEPDTPASPPAPQLQFPSSLHLQTQLQLRNHRSQQDSNWFAQQEVQSPEGSLPRRFVHQEVCLLVRRFAHEEVPSSGGSFSERVALHKDQSPRMALTNNCSPQGPPRGSPYKDHSRRGLLSPRFPFRRTRSGAQHKARSLQPGLCSPVSAAWPPQSFPTA